MKQLFILAVTAALLFACSAMPEEEKGTVEIVRYSETALEENPVVFSKVAVGDQALFDDWVYIGNNSNVVIPLDLFAIEGSNTEDCIAVIRIESVEGVEGAGGDEASEWCNGGIRKPNPLLPYNDFSVYMNVRIYEAVLWADENGQLEMNIDFDWPYEKRQRIKVSFMQYAKTK